MKKNQALLHKSKVRLVTFGLMVSETMVVGILLPETMFKVLDIPITAFSILLIVAVMYQWFFISEMIAEILLKVSKRLLVRNQNAET